MREREEEGVLEREKDNGQRLRTESLPGQYGRGNGGKFCVMERKFGDRC